MELVRRVDVQKDTIEAKIKEKSLLSDMVIPFGSRRKMLYFREETLFAAAEQFGWTLINDQNRKQIFLEVISKMDMNHSYKPVLIKAILSECDSNGWVSIDRIVEYFIDYYSARKNAGLQAEKMTVCLQRKRMIESRFKC